MREARHSRSEAGGAFARLVVWLVGVGAVGAFAWMLLLPEYVTRAIKSRTGFDASVASLSCNPFSGEVTLRGLVLSNPSSFASSDFLQVREFHLAGQVWSLFSEPVSLEELTLDVRRIALVRRSDGQSNAGLLAQNLGLGQPVSSVPGRARGRSSTRRGRNSASGGSRSASTSSCWRIIRGRLLKLSSMTWRWISVTRM
jgi:hypothetical protein